MSRYTEMTVREINYKIAKTIGIPVTEELWCSPAVVSYHDAKRVQLFDYCNNPTDMWPIILANDISLINDGVGNIGAAHDDFQQVWLPKDEALRAAAILFLMMSEGEGYE